MKVINSIQNQSFTNTQLKAFDLISQNLTQGNAILAFIVDHIDFNKCFNFDVDIVRDTFYNVETLISESVTALRNSFNTTQQLDVVYSLDQTLAKARGTMAFLIYHLDENGKFIFDYNIVLNVLWNIKTLIINAKKIEVSLNGGGNE